MITTEEEYRRCILKINPLARVVVWNRSTGLDPVYDACHIGTQPTLAECEAVLPTVQAEIQAEITARETKAAQRLEDIMVRFGPWATMKADIEAAFTDPKQQNVVKRIARVVNWLAKDSGESE